MLKQILSDHNADLYDIDELHPRPNVDLLEAEGDTPQAKKNMEYLEEGFNPVSMELRCGCRWSKENNWFWLCNIHAN